MRLCPTPVSISEPTLESSAFSVSRLVRQCFRDVGQVSDKEFAAAIDSIKNNVFIARSAKYLL